MRLESVKEPMIKEKMTVLAGSLQASWVYKPKRTRFTHQILLWLVYTTPSLIYYPSSMTLSTPFLSPTLLASWTFLLMSSTLPFPQHLE